MLDLNLLSIKFWHQFFPFLFLLIFILDRLSELFVSFPLLFSFHSGQFILLMKFVNFIPFDYFHCQLKSFVFFEIFHNISKLENVIELSPNNSLIIFIISNFLCQVNNLLNHISSFTFKELYEITPSEKLGSSHLPFLCEKVTLDLLIMLTFLEVDD